MLYVFNSFDCKISSSFFVVVLVVCEYFEQQPKRSSKRAAEIQKFIQILNECISLVVVLLLLFFCHFVMQFLSLVLNLGCFFFTHSLLVCSLSLQPHIVPHFCRSSVLLAGSVRRFYIVGISMLYAFLVCVCVFCVSCWQRWCNTNK